MAMTLGGGEDAEGFAQDPGASLLGVALLHVAGVDPASRFATATI
jgi:hypothetical protein